MTNVKFHSLSVGQTFTLASMSGVTYKKIAGKVGLAEVVSFPRDGRFTNFEFLSTLGTVQVSINKNSWVTVVA